MSLFKFPQDIVYPSHQLPLTLISLEEWSFVYVEGRDSKTYLQNQLTVDMNLLEITSHTLCAHCNFNGKVWSVMRLFFYGQGYAYIQRKSITHIQIKELQKYSIFSKVMITKIDNIFLLGVAGSNAKLFLLKFFTKIPDQKSPVIHENKKTILWFSEPSERFLLVLSLEDFVFLKETINVKVKEKFFFNNSKQWLSLDMESGFPVIDEKLCKKFTPQALNLDKLKAISFKKGCYYGQEVIARIFFKNLNKRFLCLLVAMGKIFPNIGSFIERKINNQWIKIGVLLAIVNMKHDKVWIQVVLNEPIDTNHVFRVYGFKNIFLTPNNMIL